MRSNGRSFCVYQGKGGLEIGSAGRSGTLREAG